METRGHCHVGGSPKRGYHGHSVAKLPNEIPLLVPRERLQYNKALWEAREAHWWALETAHMLEVNIDRLSQEVDSIQCQCPCSCSHSHHWGRSLDRYERFLSQHRWERHVTFLNPEEGTPLVKRPH